MSAALALVAVEAGLRWLLFGSSSLGAGFRDPGLYADYFSEDLYWKLYYRFGGAHTPPANPHPVLGWVGDFSRRDYRHRDAGRVGERRPVLLYGDSYAQCVESVTCFEDVLNDRPPFSQSHYLLNYGVGGYGFDQIYLLLRESVGLYRDPFVVVGLLTFDLDRSILSVRTGQKPRFVLDGDRLVPDPTPIDPDSAAYFARHPPEAGSYLYRRLLYSRLLPPSIADRLRGERSVREAKMALNTRILEALVGELRSRELDFVILVFHPEYPGVTELAGRDDWRDRFLRELLERHRVPFIWSKELVGADMAATGLGPEAYVDLEHRHPTTRYNRLIAAEIERLAAAD